jgi:rhodanese-related sulfurtransferase
MVESYLFTEEVPANAVVIDVRGEDEWEAWHYPGSVRRDPWELAEHLRELDRDRAYLLYCDAGTQAVFLAEQMQREGLEAYAFRGGTRSLRAQAEEPDS